MFFYKNLLTVYCQEFVDAVISTVTIVGVLRRSLQLVKNNTSDKIDDEIEDNI